MAFGHRKARHENIYYKEKVSKHITFDSLYKDIFRIQLYQ